MNRTASDILRHLEARIARLEYDSVRVAFGASFYIQNISETIESAYGKRIKPKTLRDGSVVWKLPEFKGLPAISIAFKNDTFEFMDKTKSFPLDNFNRFDSHGIAILSYGHTYNTLNALKYRK